MRFVKIAELAFLDELEKIAKKKKSSFKVLQENKVPLTEEERKLVMDRDATWNHGPNGEKTPAVWKSKHPVTGKFTYVTHTHRAYNVSKSAAGAIEKYHRFIKTTA